VTRLLGKSIKSELNLSSKAQREEKKNGTRSNINTILEYWVNQEIKNWNNIETGGKQTDLPDIENRLAPQHPSPSPQRKEVLIHT
jgi:hypothetical protein